MTAKSKLPVLFGSTAVASMSTFSPVLAVSRSCQLRSSKHILPVSRGILPCAPRWAYLNGLSRNPFPPGKMGQSSLHYRDQEDEGTFFGNLPIQRNNDFQLVDYFNNDCYLRAPRCKIEELVETYPDDPIAGSPFRRATSNEVYPQYKRLAAMLGDLFFTLTRRTFLTRLTICTLCANLVLSWLL